jgi:hypothetical protein
MLASPSLFKPIVGRTHLVLIGSIVHSWRGVTYQHRHDIPPHHHRVLEQRFGRVSPRAFDAALAVLEPLAGVKTFPEDPYRWLEVPTNPEVIAYLEAKNAGTGADMAPIREMQSRRYNEIIARIQQTELPG